MPHATTPTHHLHIQLCTHTLKPSHVLTFSLPPPLLLSLPTSLLPSHLRSFTEHLLYLPVQPKKVRYLPHPPKPHLS